MTALASSAAAARTWLRMLMAQAFFLALLVSITMLDLALLSCLAVIDLGRACIRAP
jgi:hypothetical protein